jgi:CrcB protein
MPQFVWIAIAGALGALCRWAISRGGQTLFGAGFAWGTLIVNVLGCFLIGFLMYAGLNTDKFPEPARSALAIGFLGAMTTFSTFSYETIGYLEDGSWALAGCNIAANLVIGLGATVGGLALARTLFGGTGS